MEGKKNKGYEGGKNQTEITQIDTQIKTVWTIKKEGTTQI